MKKPGLIQSVDIENLNAGANIQITANTDLNSKANAFTVSGDSDADSTTDEINGLNIGNQLTSGGNPPLPQKLMQT